MHWVTACWKISSRLFPERSRLRHSILISQAGNIFYYTYLFPSWNLHYFSSVWNVTNCEMHKYCTAVFCSTEIPRCITFQLDERRFIFESFTHFFLLFHVFFNLHFPKSCFPCCHYFIPHGTYFNECRVVSIFSR